MRLSLLLRAGFLTLACGATAALAAIPLSPMTGMRVQCGASGRTVTVNLASALAAQGPVSGKLHVTVNGSLISSRSIVLPPGGMGISVRETSTFEVRSACASFVTTTSTNDIVAPEEQKVESCALVPVTVPPLRISPLTDVRRR